MVLSINAIGQETDMWCWAATGQMAMKYLGKNVDQCVQANQRFSVNDCCLNPTPSHCIRGGWPDFNHWGFDFSRTRNQALTFSQLKNEIDNNRPVAFTWHWNGGGGHMMLAKGYRIIGNHQMVVINNPLPVRTGSSYSISYAEYVQGPTHWHWDDFYNLRPRTSPVPSGANNINSMDQKFDSAFDAAEDAMSLLLEMVISGDLQSGEEGPGSISTKAELSLGQPLKSYFIRHDSLKEFTEAAAPEDLLIDTGQLIYPVIQNGKVVSSIVIGRDEKEWYLVELGDSHRLRDLDVEEYFFRKEETRFKIEIPGIYKDFIAENVGGTLRINETSDDESMEMIRGAEGSATQVLLNCKRLAEEDRFGLTDEGTDLAPGGA